MMIFWYTVTVVVGIFLGLLVAYNPTRSRRRHSRVKTTHLDDVDEMVLWGEVTNDTFYKG